MIEWIDAYLLPLLMGLPALGAFFVSVMPPSDRITLRHAGMGASILTAVVALHAAWLLTTRPESEALVFPLRLGGGGVALALDGADLPVLLALALLVPMSLRAGAPRIVERTQGYVVLLLLAEALAISALLAKSSLLALALLDATSIPLLLLLGVFGGPFRGTASLRVGMLWFVVDAVALAAVAWLASRSSAGLWAGAAELRSAAADLSLPLAALVFLPVALAGFARLATAPLAAWLADYLEEAPVSAAALVVGVVMPLGALTVYRHGLLPLPAGALALLGPGAALAVGTAILGGLLALVERDLRRLLAFVGMTHGAVGALGLLALDVGSVSAALVFVPAMGIANAFALFIVDALERRYLVRDSAELIGVSLQLPGLWRLALLALISVIGVPLLAGGTLLLPLLSRTGAATGFAAAGMPANVALWATGGVAVAWVLIATAVMGTLKRLSSPPVRQALRAPSPLTAGQSARLWVPALVVIAAGLLGPLLRRPVEGRVAAQLTASAAAQAEEGKEGEAEEDAAGAPREEPARRWRPVAPRRAFSNSASEAP